MELRQGDRWTRNDTSLGLVTSQTDVTRVKNGTVTFTLEDGRALELKNGDLQLRHIDRAWASTVHAFQGRTVDTASTTCFIMSLSLGIASCVSIRITINLQFDLRKYGSRFRITEALFPAALFRCDTT